MQSIFKLPKNPTLRDVQAPFEVSYADSHTRQSYWTAAKAVQTMVDYFGKDRSPENIYRYQVEEYKKFLAIERGYSPATVLIYCEKARLFFRFLEHHEIVPMGHNPFAKFKIVDLGWPDRVKFEKE